MGNFKSKNRSGGRSAGRATMHTAVCSECGETCEVPFRPTGDKPVYCSECFSNKGGGDSRRSGRRDSGRFNSRDKKMYKVVCDKCGKECEVPFQPTGDKPVYCSECFGQGDKNKNSGQGGKQLELINSKLDEILQLLSATAPTSKKETKKTETTTKSDKVKAKKETKTSAKKVVATKKKVATKPKKETKAKAKKTTIAKKKTVATKKKATKK